MAPSESNDVQNLVTTTIAASGVEFRCNVDFLKNRVKQGLKNTIIKLKNLVAIRRKKALQPILAVEPTFCSCTPNLVDLNNTQTKSVQIFGYDFDNIDSLHVYAAKLDGTRTEITKLIAKPSNYTLTLGIDQNTLIGFNKIEMYMNNKGLPGRSRL